MAFDTRICIIITIASCCRADSMSIASQFPPRLHNQGQVDFLRAPGLLDLHGHPKLSEGRMQTPFAGDLAAMAACCMNR